MLIPRLLLLAVFILGLDTADPDDLAPPPAWLCPAMSQSPAVACSCDLPHTLRCTGDSTALHLIARRLRDLTPPATVSLLDCTVQNVSAILDPLLVGVTLHGLVVSSGEIHHVSARAFTGLAGPLQALGLPSNMLEAVPSEALAALPTLDRLDLSHNRLQKLDNNSFRGLRNLSFLELSDNVLTHLLPDAFATLPSLRTLRLRGNRLTVNAVSTLRRLRGLQELDLSDNLLAGPLGSTTFSRIPKLRILQLAHNQFTSIRQDALTGFNSLASLSLHHNQIDVLEDHAFRSLGSLTQLDLAHNRIVAVSGSSLAHLTQLVQLDLAHNFLRALTADLVVPLQSLRELRLDDNDISIVTSDAMTTSLFQRLTLADNPLNCDCSLAEFATWLTNASQLSSSDRATAVCATPPSLENGLLLELRPEELVCGEDENSVGPAPPQGPLVDRVPVSGAQVTLNSFLYDGYGITLLWNVAAKAAPYTCDALFVYEEVDVNEVLLESNPLRCNSSQFADPRALSVTLASLDLQPGHRYRYCIVLLEGGGKTSDEMALVLGCSEIIALVPTSRPQPQSPPPPGVTSTTRIKELNANITTPSTLAVSMVIWDRQMLKPRCVITLEIFINGALMVHRQLNCSSPRTLLHGLPDGPYRVCATLGELPRANGPRGRCVTVQQPRESRGFGGINVALTAVFVVLSSLLLLGLVCVTKRLLTKPKLMPTHQCFLAAPQEEEQHSRYVKLQATTKL